MYILILMLILQLIQIIHNIFKCMHIIIILVITLLILIILSNYNVNTHTTTHTNNNNNDMHIVTNTINNIPNNTTKTSMNNYTVII